MGVGGALAVACRAFRRRGGDDALGGGVADAREGSDRVGAHLVVGIAGLGDQARGRRCVAPGAERVDERDAERLVCLRQCGAEGGDGGGGGVADERAARRLPHVLVGQQRCEPGHGLGLADAPDVGQDARARPHGQGGVEPGEEQLDHVEAKGLVAWRGVAAAEHLELAVGVGLRAGVVAGEAGDKGVNGRAVGGLELARRALRRLGLADELLDERLRGRGLDRLGAEGDGHEREADECGRDGRFRRHDSLLRFRPRPPGMPKPTCHRPGARAGAGQVACHLSGSLTVLPVRADL